MATADDLTVMMLDLIFADYEKDDEVAALAPATRCSFSSIRSGPRR